MRRRAGWLGRFGGVPWSPGKVTTLPEASLVARRKIWSGRAPPVVAKVGAALQAEARAQAARWLSEERVGRNRSGFYWVWSE